MPLLLQYICMRKPTSNFLTTQMRLFLTNGCNLGLYFCVCSKWSLKDGGFNAKVGICWNKTDNRVVTVLWKMWTICRNLFGDCENGWHWWNENNSRKAIQASLLLLYIKSHSPLVVIFNILSKMKSRLVMQCQTGEVYHFTRPPSGRSGWSLPFFTHLFHRMQHSFQKLIQYAPCLLLRRLTHLYTF